MARMNKSRFALLGLLSLGAMSGYDLRKLFEQSLIHFWSESFGQIYPMLRSLAAGEPSESVRVGDVAYRMPISTEWVDTGLAAFSKATHEELDAVYHELTMLLGFIALALLMLWNSGVAAYHAGIEWKFWPGPQDCTGPIDKFGSVQNLMKQLQHINLVRCDVASWRFLGLSLAGWDVPLSLSLAAVAAWGAKVTRARAS